MRCAYLPLSTMSFFRKAYTCLIILLCIWSWISSCRCFLYVGPHLWERDAVRVGLPQGFLEQDSSRQPLPDPRVGEQDLPVTAASLCVVCQARFFQAFADLCVWCVWGGHGILSVRVSHMRLLCRVSVLVDKLDLLHCI